jgi:pimeloyl-ACP methyl ester carboxylesterase
LPPKKLEVPVSGGNLAVYELGDAPAQAPAVVAVHGITGNSHSWIAVARALGDQARLLAVDLRGRGDSRELPGPYGLAAHGQDLLAVLEHQHFDRAVLTGHSLGGYIVASFAVAHPERVSEAVLVDGGLRIPGLAVEDPGATVKAFLGPTFERLEMRFASREAYRDWWLAHPAIAGSDIAPDDLAAYLDHDLVGSEPELRSSASPDAVLADGADLLTQEEAAAVMTVPATLLCAPFGLRGEPSPMQPFELAEAWAAGSPRLRKVMLIPELNHYTITLGRSGAAAVAGVLLEATARP